MKSATSIASIVRRATLIIFTFALIIGSVTFYLFFNAASMRHVEGEARALLGLAVAARNYTAENITPLLSQLQDDEFHSETVPSFAAQTIFRRFVSQKSNYTYREAATNPTNPNDLATRFEAELIANFRSDRSKLEAQGIHHVDGEPIFYIARPVIIKKAACLACHSTPDVAPSKMVDIYGAVNGFGWKLNEIIGVQVLTIPVTEEFQSIYELVAIFFIMLVTIFLVVSIMAMLLLQRNIIQPLRQLVNVADRSSLRNDETPFPKEGAGEIKTLAIAISRMRTSLNVSTKKTGDGD